MAGGPAGLLVADGASGKFHEPIFRTLRSVIFKAIADGRPYPEHGYATPKQWSSIPPRQIRLSDMVTTKRTLDLGNLLSEDSTFYGDLFAHVVLWRGTYYLEDGLHRAVRAALYQRQVLHVRVLDLAELGLDRPAYAEMAKTSELPVVDDA